MSAIGGIPMVPWFELTRPQLAQVVCQVRFSPVLRIRQDDAIVPFQEAMRGEYPRYSRQEGLSVLITPAGIQSQRAPDGLHRFDDSSGSLSALLAADFVGLETTRFTHIDDFVARMVRLVSAVDEHYAPAEISRIGLRFVNELRFGSGDAKAEMLDAIAPSLLGALSTAELSEPLVGAQQAIELTGGDHRILVRHGLNHQGSTTVDVLSPEAPPASGRPFYLLDIDAFTDQTVRYSVEGIEARLREFNDMIRSFFAWSVREGYRRGTLGQKDPG